MATDSDHITMMFNDIAPTYDKLNHILSLNIDKLWRKKAVKCVKKAVCGIERPKVLDVACGTADSTIQLAKSLGFTRIHAIDVSDKMLDIAKEKVEKLVFEQRMKISFTSSCAENIVFQDDVFDAVFVAFGVRNFSDRGKGLMEILRVMKPGGTLVILELSEPQNVIVRWLYDLYFKNILPLVGKLVSGNKDAYRYLQQTVEKFPMPKEFVKILENIGYQDIRHKALTCGLCRIYQAKKA